MPGEVTLSHIVLGPLQDAREGLRLVGDEGKKEGVCLAFGDTPPTTISVDHSPLTVDEVLLIAAPQALPGRKRDIYTTRQYRAVPQGWPATAAL